MKPFDPSDFPKLHRDLWSWMSLKASRGKDPDKSSWPGWKDRPDALFDCFACEHAFPNWRSFDNRRPSGFCPLLGALCFRGQGCRLGAYELFQDPDATDYDIWRACCTLAGMPWQEEPKRKEPK